MEEKRLHSTFQEKEEDLRLSLLVLDQIKDLVTITDLNGVITYVNDAEVKALKRHREEIIGSTTNIFGEDSERGASQREIIEKTHGLPYTVNP